MEWIVELQNNLGVTADGIMGPKTLEALFVKLGAKPARAKELATGSTANFKSFGITDSPLRFAHFIAQVAHESGNFVYMEEIWGPTVAQKRYEGRKDLGNIHPGDGYRYKGRGPIQITGRANYEIYGKLLGIDLVNNPGLAARPDIGLKIAMQYWRQKNLNTFADADDINTITKRINGGHNGLSDRKTKLATMKKLLGI